MLKKVKDDLNFKYAMKRKWKRL